MLGMEAHLKPIYNLVLCIKIVNLIMVQNLEFSLTTLRYLIVICTLCNYIPAFSLYNDENCLDKSGTSRS
jgi:hypothetical protein